MNPREYAELCTRLGGKQVEFSVSFLEIGILLGAIRLLIDHPDVEAYAGSLDGMIYGIRQALLDALMDLGLTAKQVNELNTMYGSETTSIANEFDMERAKSRSKLKVITSPEKDY